MRTTLFTAALVISGVAAHAQTTAPATQSAEVVRFTLHPAATGQPALQYPLLPPMTDRRPGNAAVQYMIAAAEMPPAPWDEHASQESKNWYRIDEQLDVPTDSFSISVADAALSTYPFRWLDLAARRDEANWDVDIRGLGINGLLPQLNFLRAMANALTVRTRLDIARGDFAAADQSLQSGFAMAEHLDHGLLVQSLVSIGISEMTLSKGVTDWISRGGPNLYWSLGNLPAPVVDLRAVADIERAVVPCTDTRFLQAFAGTLPADQWRPTLEEFMQLSVSNGDPTKRMSALTLTSEYGQYVKSAYARAKQRLERRGLTSTQIEAMSKDQAVGELAIDDYQIEWDEIWKAWPLTYPEAAPILRSTSESAAKGQSTVYPLRGLIPKIFRARNLIARADRHLAALRIIEAIRDYAARHDGKLPQTLAEVTALPIPFDPVTGKPFKYHVIRSVGVLTPIAVPDLHGGIASYELSER